MFCPYTSVLSPSLSLPLSISLSLSTYLSIYLRRASGNTVNITKHTTRDSQRSHHTTSQSSTTSQSVQFNDDVVPNVQFVSDLDDDFSSGVVCMFVATRSGEIHRFLMDYDARHDGVDISPLAHASDTQHHEQLTLDNQVTCVKISALNASSVLTVTSDGMLLCIAVDPELQSSGVQVEVKAQSTMSRFFTGLVYRSSSPEYAVVDAVAGGGNFAFALCSDGFLRMWSISPIAMVHQVKVAAGSLAAPAASGQLCMKIYGASASDPVDEMETLQIAMYADSLFTILQVDLPQDDTTTGDRPNNSGSIVSRVIHRVASPQSVSRYPLIDMHIDAEVCAVWGMWRRSKIGADIFCWPFGRVESPASHQFSAGLLTKTKWHSVGVSAVVERNHELEDMLQCFAQENGPDVTADDIKWLYARRIFLKQRFDDVLLQSVLHRKRLSSDFYSKHSGAVAGSRREVERAVTDTIEFEMQLEFKQYDSNTIREETSRCWQGFLKQCTHMWLSHNEDSYAGFGVHVGAASAVPYIVKTTGLSLLRTADASELHIFSRTAVDIDTELTGDMSLVPAVPLPISGVAPLRIKTNTSRLLFASHLLAEEMTRGSKEMHGMLLAFDDTLVDLDEENVFEEACRIYNSTDQHDTTRKSRLRRTDARMLSLVTSISHPQEAFSYIFNSLQPDSMDLHDHDDDHDHHHHGASMLEQTGTGPSLRCLQNTPGWTVDGAAHCFRSVVASRFRLLRELLYFITYLVETRVGLKMRGAALLYLETEGLARVVALLKTYAVLRWFGQQVSRPSLHRASVAEQNWRVGDDTTLPSYSQRASVPTFDMVHSSESLLHLLLEHLPTLEPGSSCDTKQDVKQDISLTSAASERSVESVSQRLLHALFVSTTNSSSHASFFRNKAKVHRIVRFLNSKLEYAHSQELLNLTGLVDDVEFQQVLAECAESAQDWEQVKRRMLIVAQSPTDAYKRLLEHVRMIDNFERFGKDKSVYCLEFAYAALSIDLSGCPLQDAAFSATEYQSLLWSKIFKHALSLDRFDEAYSALISIQDGEVRKECLRRFVVVLSACRRIHTLCSYPWVGLRKEVESVLWWKAQTSDLTGISELAPSAGTVSSSERGHVHEDSDVILTNYYEVLYSFMVSGNDFGSAAKYMYVYALRLENEADLTDANFLQKLANALAAVITAVSCCPDHDWILSSQSTSTLLRHALNPRKRKRGESKSTGAADNAGANASAGTTTSDSDSGVAVYIVTLTDLRKRLALCQAYLKLASVTDNYRPYQCDIHDTISLLMRAGYVDMAMSIVLQFSLDASIVFQGLVLKCVALQLSGSSSGVKLVFENTMGSSTLMRTDNVGV
jgi:Nucleoporin Nup120/160